MKQTMGSPPISGEELLQFPAQSSTFLIFGRKHICTSRIDGHLHM